ncbi:MAG: hypothetical protein WA628_09150 [Terriglobales bacterium]
MAQPAYFFVPVDAACVLTLERRSTTVYPCGTVNSFGFGSALPDLRDIDDLGAVSRIHAFHRYIDAQLR